MKKASIATRVTTSIWLRSLHPLPCTSDLLKKIGIDEYLFCGITYNARLDIGEKKPIEFITKYLGSDIPQGDLYEASRNIAIVKNERFFVNQKIGTYKEFQGIPGSIPNLFEIGSVRTV